MKRNKQKLKKGALGIFKTILTILFLVICVESGKFWLFLVGLMLYGAIKIKHLYKSFFISYWYMLKRVWNREEVDLQAMIPSLGGTNKGHTKKIYKYYETKIKKKKKRL